MVLEQERSIHEAKLLDFLIKNPDNTDPNVTMEDALTSIPGFEIKPKRKAKQKLSYAAQVELMSTDGIIDVEAPESVLTHVNIHDILDMDAFDLLPPLYQYTLMLMLPSVDRPVITDSTGKMTLVQESFKNAFYMRACSEWRDRLSEGEFLLDHASKNRIDAQKKANVDPWKLKHFEPIWGDKKAKVTFIQRKAAKVEPKVNERAAKLAKRRSTLCSTSSDEIATKLHPVASSSKSQPTPAAAAVNHTNTSGSSRPPLKTTISMKTVRELKQQQEQQHPKTPDAPLMAPVPYTTSSGRLVKNPNLYSVSFNTSSYTRRSQTNECIPAPRSVQTRRMTCDTRMPSTSDGRAYGSSRASEQACTSVDISPAITPTKLPANKSVRFSEPLLYNAPNTRAKALRSLAEDMAVQIIEPSAPITRTKSTKGISDSMSVQSLAECKSVPISGSLSCSITTSTRTTSSKDSTDGKSVPISELLACNTFTTNEKESLSKLPDIEIIRRDENEVGKSIPHDIPAVITLFAVENPPLSGKRAPKRNFSPETTTSKVTKPNDYNVMGNDVSLFNNAITMSPYNVKMLRDSPNSIAQLQQQRAVETSISIHAHNVPSGSSDAPSASNISKLPTIETYTLDKNGKVKHTLSITSVPQALTSSVTIMATSKPIDIKA